MNAWLDVGQGVGGCLWTVVEKRWGGSRVGLWQSRLRRARVHHPKQVPLSFVSVQEGLPDDHSATGKLERKK